VVDTQAITIRLPKDLYERLRMVAFERRVSMASLITEALATYLKEGDLP